MYSCSKHVEGSEVKEEGAHEAVSVNVDTTLTVLILLQLKQCIMNLQLKSKDMMLLGS
jgi:hypothetical protein